MELSSLDWVNWIDVCPNNGNLLASVGNSQRIKIYDRRSSKIAIRLDNAHLGNEAFSVD